MNEKIKLTLSTYKDRETELLSLLNKDRSENWRVKIRTLQGRISLNSKEINELKELLQVETNKFKFEEVEKRIEKFNSKKTINSKKQILELMKNIPGLMGMFEEAGVE